MNSLSVVKALIGLGCASALYAQATPSLSAEAKRNYETVKGNLTKAADKMADENYTFKPTPDQRSFAEVVIHVVNAQIRGCSAIAGDSKTINLSGKTAKAEIVAGLKESFEECDKAYGMLTDANAAEGIKTPRGESTRLGALAGNTTHDVEQYAILSVYLRLKGLVPPTSEKADK